MGTEALQRTSMLNHVLQWLLKVAGGWAGE